MKTRLQRPQPFRISHSARKRSGIRLLIGTLSFWLCLLSGLLGADAHAATLTVANGNDSGEGSLRQAIADAAAGDTITFTSGLSIVTLTTAELLVEKNITINGPGANIFTVQRSTAEDTPEFRVFRVESGTTVSISGLTIANGFANAHPLDNASSGGGIQSFSNLTINGCNLSGNRASWEGGAIYNGGTLTLINSTLSGNIALGGGGLYTGGTATVTNCTISGNSVMGDGGGGGLLTRGTTTLGSSTVALNSAGGAGGGGIYIGAGTLNMGNTIVAANTSPNRPNCAGDFNSQGYNLIQDPTGAVISGTITGNIYNVDPLLGPLQDNDGPTQTMALLAGSPAIDVGNDASAPATDQRGYLRSGRSDIGAYEYNGPASILQFGAATYSVDENGGSATITVTRNGTATAASVNYAVTGGSAANGTDYTLEAGTLNFSAGQSSRSFDVSITDDSLIEGDETVMLALSTPTGGIVGTPATATLTIIDNDFPTISGRIADSSGNGIASVSVSRDGAPSGSGSTPVLTDSNGNYTFIGVVAGSYTITPGKSGYAFSPMGRSVDVANANVAGVNFTGTPTPTITSFTPSSAIVGATITINGTNFLPVTQVSFNGTSTTFTINSATQITVMVPSGATTGPISVTSPGGSATSSTIFTVIPVHTISGCITNSSGVGIAGAGVTRSNSSGSTTVQTDSNGNHTFSDVPAGSYTLSVTRVGYTFAPAGFTNPVAVSDDRSDLNFTATATPAGTYSINGRVANHSRAGIASVLVRRVAGTSTSHVYTDANGNFTFSGVPTGSYTIVPVLTPAMSGMNFAPTSRNVSLANGNIYSQNFIATFSISGRLANHSGAGIAGVLLQRTTGTSTVSIYTDASGNFKFSNVRSGSYTLTPVLTSAMNGMSFSPTSRSVTVDRGSILNQNFIGMFSISGRIATSSGTAIAGVLVRLGTGSSTITAQTDSNGNFKFSNVRSGSYTLTPVLNGKTFNPASRSVTVSTLNVLSQNFVGSTN